MVVLNQAQYLPVGNGYMGMMQSGRPDYDEVVLNLESLWSGGPYNPANNVWFLTLSNVRLIVFAVQWR